MTGIIHAYDEVPRNCVQLEQLHKVVIHLQQRTVGLERYRLSVTAMLWSHKWQLAHLDSLQSSPQAKIAAIDIGQQTLLG